MASTSRNHRGWRLVNVNQNHYVAAKGNVRLPVGAIRHGDFDDLLKRFRMVVDEHEAAK